MSLALVALPLLLLSVTTPDELRVAEEAFARRDFEAVLPPLATLLKQPQLSLADRIRAHELRALCFAAFDASSRSIDEFTAILRLQNSYDPGTRVSPKVRGLFSEARLRVPLALTAQAPPPAKEEPRGLLSQWWFWTAAGVLVAGSVTVIALQPSVRVPDGNVPGGVLP